LNLGDAEIQEVEDKAFGENIVQIRTAELGPAGVRRVQDLLRRDYGVKAEGFQIESIGPTFGETVAKSAIYAIIFSLLAITAYISFRFEFKFAVPILIAVFHDILITSGVYSLLDRDVTTSTVAALLTILGYSLYDTVIVFDRVRENTPRMPRAAFSQIVNRSMSEVLTRSLATSFCTCLPVFALMMFGGETLQDFAFALLVGIVSGTYSSIFIASPLLTESKEREPTYRQRRRRIIDELGYVPAYAASPTPTAVGATAAKSDGALAKSALDRAPKPVEDGLSPEPVEAEPEDLAADDVEADDVPATEPAEVGGPGPAAERQSSTRPPKSQRKKRKQSRRKHGRNR
jgi:SecD/SecF fusion protein